MGGKLRYLARMGDAFTIRLATVADAPALARHRAEMFRDMGDLPDELYDPLVDAARRALDACLRTGEYVGWVVCPADHPDEIVAGAGKIGRASCRERGEMWGGAGRWEGRK